MNSLSRHHKRLHSLLDGIWDFAFLGPVEDPTSIAPESITFTDRMPVPSAWDAYPAYAGKRGAAAYRTRFSVPAGTGAFLRFRGTGMWNRIFVDGKELHTFSLPYSQVEVALPIATHTERELIVLNDNRFDKQRVPLQHNIYDFYAYGGIFRSVELHVVPEVFLKRVRLLSPDASTGTVVARIELSGIASGELPATIHADGQKVWDSTLSIHKGCAAVTFQVPDAKPWSAATPHLHEIRIEAADDDLCQRIGFRTIDASSERLLINGEPIKLLGYCRHESHPQFGPALPIQQLVQDLQILKDMGCNFIRGSHYPQDPDFLDLCDELGFYVFEETLGWGNIGPELEEPAFCSGQLEQARLMIDKSFNHPSVIIWGYLNEGGSSRPHAVALYRQLYELCKGLDGSRPVAYATNVPFHDICYDYCDAVCVNYYPGWYAANDEETRPLHEINETLDSILAHVHSSGYGGKPFLLTEIGAGAIYGWRDPLNAHWTEDYQSEYLEIVCKRVINDERISGVALWQFCDGRTYSSSRALTRPRAFNNKGSLDEYRRPKLAQRTVRQIFRAAADQTPGATGL